MIEGVITRTSGNVVNVRSKASTNGVVMDTLKVGSKVNYDPTLSKGESYKIAGIEYDTWYKVNNGYVAEKAVTISDVSLRLLDVPFVSQLGVDANEKNNDCGVACALMLIQYKLKRVGLRPMRGLTVDKLVDDTPLAKADTPQPLSMIVNLIDMYGMSAKIHRPFTPDQIIMHLDLDKPSILLVNYKHLGGKSFGHYVVALGYSENGFFVHDPYLRGQNLYMTTESLSDAMSDVSNFAAFAYQAVILE